MIQCEIARDIGILDCYRYYNGVPYRGAFPIIVQFKARREKEQLLWRSKDRLRKINIVVTDDIALRQNIKIESPVFQDVSAYQLRKDQISDKKMNPSSSKKKQKEGLFAAQSLFGDLF